jgi:hypothetical protein
LWGLLIVDGYLIHGGNGLHQPTTSGSECTICSLALLMLVRGVADAIMMRAQLALASAGAHG